MAAQQGAGISADVIITIATQLQDTARKNLQAIQASAAKHGQEYSKEFAKHVQEAQKQMQGLNQKKFELKQTLDPAAYKEVMGIYTQLGKSAQGRALPPIQRLNLALKKQQAILKANKKEFAGWAMSLMFAGMAMKQQFDSIWRASTKTFNDVMQSVEGTVTGFMMLDGALKYLGFTAGQALEPIAYFLIPIIDKVSEWILQNERLFQGIMIALGAGGTVLMAFGMIKLALDGAVLAVGKLKLAWTGAMAVLGAGSLPVLAVLAIITGAVLAAILLWRTNFGGFADTLKAIWESIRANFALMWAGVKNIFVGAWEFISGFMEGNNKKMQKGFLRMILGLLQAITGLSRLIQDVMLNVLNFIIRAAIAMVVTPIQLMLQSLRDAFAFAGLGTGLIDNALQKLKQVKDWDPLRDTGLMTFVDKNRAQEDKALQIAGDFIVNIDTADDADGLIAQLRDAIARGA